MVSATTAASSHSPWSYRAKTPLTRLALCTRPEISIERKGTKFAIRKNTSPVQL
jgi:hypothetical protein